MVRNGPLSLTTEERLKTSVDSALQNNLGERSQSRDLERSHSRDLERSHSRELGERSHSRDLGERSHSQDSNREINPVKEERKDIMIIDEKRGTLPPKPDDLLIRNNILKDPRKELLGFASAYGPPGLPPTSVAAMSLEQRARLMNPLNPYLAGLDRVGHPGANPMAMASMASLWNPLGEKSVMDHRLELQREMERQQDRMLNRFPNPLGTMIDHERIREQQEMMIRERALRERETLERMAAIDRERAAMIADMERSGKIPPLRPIDPYSLPGLPHGGPGALYPPRPGGAGSPLVNHNSTHGSKTNSPSSSVGAPPPLIPSGSIRPHTASPSTKPKPPSPTMTNSNHSDSLPSSAISKDKPPIQEGATIGNTTTTNGLDTNHSQSR